MNAPTFLLDGSAVPYRVRVSSRCRRMGLRFSDTGLEVVLPPRLAAASPEPLFRRFSHWIRRQLERQARTERLRQEAAKTILVRGEALRRETVEGPALDNFCTVSIDSGTFRVHVPQGRADLADGAARAFLFEEAKRELARAVARLSALMEQPYGSLRLGDQRTLWGSCSPRSGTLSFNARLIMAPPAALDYLVVHELAHFRWSGHGVRFWDRVAKFCPDHRVQRRWLRENAWRLVLPGSAPNLVQ